MNYQEIGANIRKIRENELRKTREEFAEEIGISPITIARLENGTSKVKNIETYKNISNVSGHTIEELLLESTNINEKQKNINKINHLLNNLSIEELDYIYEDINKFIKFIHKKDKNKEL